MVQVQSCAKLHFSYGPVIFSIIHEKHFQKLYKNVTINLENAVIGRNHKAS